MSAVTTGASTPLENALTLLEDAVSPLVGLVTGVTSRTAGTDESRLPNISCDAASIGRFHPGAAAPSGDGAHPDPRRARAAAIGESLERYSALVVRTDELIRTTPRSLGPVAVRPERFALFHPTQYANSTFGFVPFTEETEALFAPAWSLPDGRRAYLPAELVYLCPPVGDGPRIGYVTSSGLACAPTFAEAVLTALLELVERDAVMLAWKCQLSLPLLDWSDDSDLLELERTFFDVPGLSYSVLDGSSFLDIPVAIGVLRGNPETSPALSVGAGSAKRPADAWLKALTECFGVRSWLIVDSALHPDRPPLPLDQVRTFDDHMAFYAGRGNASLTRFFDGSSVRRPIDEVAEIPGSTPTKQIEAVCERLARHGVTAYAVDVTAPDVRQLGLSVARVVAPELCALDVIHTARYQGGKRLYEAPRAAGFPTAPRDITGLTDLPHPFP